MKLIFAQGNPGSDYATSRHNVGFMALDVLAAAKGASFTDKPKFHAQIAEYNQAGEKVLLVKPTTFYNETGRSARALCDFYKASPAHDLLVIHDDLALPLGTLRVREKGSDAGNNGIKSLNAHLGHDYARLRVGIYSELRDRMPDASFVLASFNQGEALTLKNDIIPKIHELVEQFCADKLDVASYKI